MQRGLPMHRYTVVSNATPIILLQNIGQLHLLKALYGAIYIPRAVYDEIAVKNKLTETDSWINVVDIENKAAKRLLCLNLHNGEAEALLLSTELNADLLLLDDLAARKYAQAIGLSISGTLGVLVALKRNGTVDAVKPLLQMLVANGMYIADNLQRNVLDMVGELHGT